MRNLLLILSVFFAVGCGNDPTPVNNAAAKPAPTAETAPPFSKLPVHTYEVVNTYPHDPAAFTQGLIFYGGMLYESTGNYGRSTLRKTDLKTGKVILKRDLGEDFFGEGITIFKGKIYQLTWREDVVFVYDLSTMEPSGEFRYRGEAWGLTNNDTHLILSDGTQLLKFIDPETFKVVRTVPVSYDDDKPLYLLNELEWVNGEIWANIWHSEQKQTGPTPQGMVPNIGRPNHIARINPETGKVVGWIDLSGISPDDQPKKDDPYDPKAENTLNGIAYDAENDRVFVTGKQWRKLFEIKIKPKE